MNDRTVIVVVDDDPDLADLFSAWLEGTYEVRTAYGGAAGLETIDDEVDVVLVDRLMPGTSGDEVVATLEDREWNGQVAMVTAVEPDFDILGLGIDDYLLKPVFRDALETTVEGLLERASYDESLQELFALTTKRATLESRKTNAELADSEEYGRLLHGIRDLHGRLEEITTALDDSGLEVSLRGVNFETPANERS
jgi:DNA-binding response OmpR family regulator